MYGLVTGMGDRGSERASGLAAHGALACWLATITIAAGSLGCTSTTSTQTVSSPVSEQRWRLDPKQPVVSSEWRLEGTQIVGHIAWAVCGSQRKWTSSVQRRTHLEPIPAVGWGLLGGAAALQIVNWTTRDYDAGPRDSKNDVANVALITGALAAIAGTLVLVVEPSDRVTTLKSEAYTQTKNGPCITESDLSTLVLVLKLAEKRFAHVTVEATGTAHVDLPAGTRLVPGSDLPILVYRAPKVAANELHPWQVVGTLHVPE